MRLPRTHALRAARLLALLVPLLLLGAPPAAHAQASASWSVVTGVPATVTLEDVAAIGPGEAWAVGATAEPRQGVIYRLSYTGGRWVAALAATLPQPLSAVDAVSERTAWAAGAAVVARYDSGAWSAVQTPATLGQARAVSVVSDDEVWVGGTVYYPQGETRTGLLHYSGGQWALDQSIGGFDLFDMSMRRDGGWAVGNLGLWRYRDGAWSPEATPSPCAGGDGCYASPSSVWSAGDDVVVAGSWGSPCFACTKAGPLLARHSADGWRLLLPDGTDGLGGLTRTGQPLYAPLAELDFWDAGSGVVVGAIQDPAQPGPRRPLAVRYLDGAWGVLSMPPVSGGLKGVTMVGRDGALAVGEGGLVLAYGFAAAPLPTARVDDPRAPGELYFAETGHTLRGRFRDYWQRYGGLARFGFPLTEEYSEDGRQVQYFERARFELHLENQPPYDVLFGLLAREGTVERRGLNEFAPAAPAPGLRFFPETQHNMAAELAGYWERAGGLPVFGYPISEPFMEINQADGRPYLVQYFERNRLEYHPELPEPYRVSLGLLGTEILRARGW